MIPGYLNYMVTPCILNNTICGPIQRPNRQGFGDLHILTIKTIIDLNYMPVRCIRIIYRSLDEGKIFASVDVMNPVHRSILSDGYLAIVPDCWYHVRTVVNKLAIRYVQKAIVAL